MTPLRYLSIILVESNDTTNQKHDTLFIYYEGDDYGYIKNIE